MKNCTLPFKTKQSNSGKNGKNFVVRNKTIHMYKFVQ